MFHQKAQLPLRAQTVPHPRQRVRVRPLLSPQRPVQRLELRLKRGFVGLIVFEGYDCQPHLGHLPQFVSAPEQASTRPVQINDHRQWLRGRFRQNSDALCPSVAGSLDREPTPVERIARLRPQQRPAKEQERQYRQHSHGFPNQRTEARRTTLLENPGWLRHAAFVFGSPVALSGLRPPIACHAQKPPASKYTPVATSSVSAVPA